MNDLNNVSIIGRLTRDAELKYTQGGYPVASFSIAVNRSRKDGEKFVDEASFFECSMFGKSAESLKQYMTKGKQIAVIGELRQERWESDGQSRSRVVIVANNVQLLGGKSEESAPAHTNGYGQRQTSGYQKKQGAPAQPELRAEPYPSKYEPMQPTLGGGFNEDIPF